MKFIQPDRIIPEPYNSQAWNRYSYVLNNPVLYNDPTGNTVDCGVGDSCDSINRYVLKKKYDWKLKDRWSLDEFDTIYETGRDIEKYADDRTGGNGREWMMYAFGNTTIEHVNFGDGHSDTWPIFGENFGPRIRLDHNWLTHSDWTAQEIFSHELGHVWDINSGFAASGKMNKDLGGSSLCFFCSPGADVPQWNARYHKYNGDAYGNGQRNEYFAEAFSASIYNPTKTPHGVSAWVGAQLSIDLIGELAPGGLR